jgi:hypothetical protein
VVARRAEPVGPWQRRCRGRSGAAGAKRNRESAHAWPGRSGRLIAVAVGVAFAAARARPVWVKVLPPEEVLSPVQGVPDARNGALKRGGPDTRSRCDARPRRRSRESPRPSDPPLLARANVSRCTVASPARGTAPPAARPRCRYPPRSLRFAAASRLLRRRYAQGERTSRSTAACVRRAPLRAPSRACGGCCGAARGAGSSGRAAAARAARPAARARAAARPRAAGPRAPATPRG